MTPIVEYGLEQGVYALFQEWLAGFFNGQANAIGANAPVLFPKAVLGFGQSQLAQPLNPVQGRECPSPEPVPVVGITMVFMPEGKTARRWEVVNGVRQRMSYRPVRWNFWIRTASATGTDRALCLKAGDLLTGILGNAAATRALSQNGIRNLRPGAIQPVADTGYMLRLLPCCGQLRYAVLSQPTT
jgi:hypothetical protein